MERSLHSLSRQAPAGSMPPPVTVTAVRRTQWFDHVGALHVSRDLRGWLTDTGSMTFKLRAHSNQFGVRRLRQHGARVLADEAALLGIVPRARVQQRDVLLLGDGQPLIFGHTSLTHAADWPFFSTLNEKPLGATLFADPLVRRGRMQFARMHNHHPLARRLCDALGLAQLDRPVPARRSLFVRRDAVMLVTELFLPAIDRLQAAALAALPDSPRGSSL